MEHSVAKTLIRVLGAARLAVAGVVLGVGAFLLLALSQASHFDWGFQFLEAAVVFAVVAPLVMFIDTALVVGSLIRRRPRSAADEGSQAGEVLGMYLVVMWALIGFYCAVVF